MHETERMNQWLERCFRGSGMPISRRLDIADEWRSHIETEASALEVQGMIRSEAMDTALRRFGRPETLRRQLRWQQLRKDMRDAFLSCRRQSLWIMAPGAIFAAVIALFAPGFVPLSVRVTGGLGLIVDLVGAMAIAVFVGTFLEQRIKRERPRNEYNFAASMCCWTVIVMVLLVATVLFMPLMFAYGGHVGKDGFLLPIIYNTYDPDMPVIEGGRWFFVRNFGMSFVGSPIRGFLVPALAILAGAWILARYERSRCVENPFLQGSERKHSTA